MTTNSVPSGISSSSLVFRNLPSLANLKNVPLIPTPCAARYADTGDAAVASARWDAGTMAPSSCLCCFNVSLMWFLLALWVAYFDARGIHRNRFLSHYNDVTLGARKKLRHFSDEAQRFGRK